MCNCVLQLYFQFLLILFILLYYYCVYLFIIIIYNYIILLILFPLLNADQTFLVCRVKPVLITIILLGNLEVLCNYILISNTS